jgi:hypothetical protein
MRCADLHGTPSPGKLSVPAGVLIVLAVLMTGSVLQVRSLFDWQLVGVVGLAVGCPLGYLACSDRIDRQIKDCCWLLMLGYLGMLAGLMFDAGGLGFWQLLALCRSGGADFSTALQSACRMPAAYLGMAAACQCGMWLLPARGRGLRNHYVRFVAINVSMAVGMNLGHWAAVGLAADLSGRAFGGLVLLSMLAGMAASGMLVHRKGGTNKVA